MNTLLHRLYDWANINPNAPAQAFKKNDTWVRISVIEMMTRVEELAQYLTSIGVVRGDIGLIYAYNSPEWVQIDLAFMLVGASSAGIYSNASLRQIYHILTHSEAKILFVESMQEFEKIFKKASLEDISPYLKKLIVLNEAGQTLPDYAVSFVKACELGRSVLGSSYKEYLAKIELTQRAILIYTSGTTGESKAVSLSHENIAFASQCYAGSWEAPKVGKLFSFLPLAHIAERITNLGIGLSNRYTVYFCSNSMSIGQELREVQPTIVLAVPRLWDKLKEGVEKRISRLPDKRKKLMYWALEVGRSFQNKKVNAKSISVWLYVKYYIANKLVLIKIRNQLGLAEALRVVSGAAAISMATLDWYRSIGVIIIEAYALSESSGVLTCGNPTFETAGTVGVPYEGIEIRFGDDGEIQTRGPHVFQDYYKDSLATSAMKRDDWLLNGDIGQIDSAGNLKISGRKRDIIKTAEGKMVSPLYLEAQLEMHELIDQAIVIGNEKPYIVVLLTLVELPRPVVNIHEIIQNHINKINQDLASHERIKKFRLLNTSFSIENEESTATMKIKRNVIEKNYQSQISSMY